MSLVSATGTMPSMSSKLFRILSAAVCGQRPSRKEIEEENRARREFILDMMHYNPEALQSELGIQMMMHVYPSKF